MRFSGIENCLYRFIGNIKWRILALGHKIDPEDEFIILIIYKLALGDPGIQPLTFRRESFL